MTIVTGIQAVGVILMSALLIIPLCQCQVMDKKLSTMLILSLCDWSIAGITGTLLVRFEQGYRRVL